MANDLATLKTAIALKLRDSTNAIWSANEFGDLLTWACARLYPRISTPVIEDVALVDSTDHYTLTDVADISRVDIIDPNSSPANQLVMQLNGGTWEWRPTAPNEAGGTLYINPQFASASWKARVIGYAPYDLVTNLPGDRFVQTILGIAAAEAIRRMVTDRAKFKTWATFAQEQNISMTEMIAMVNEGDNDYRQMLGEMKVWRRPKPALR